MRSRRIFLATIVASSLFGTACLRDVGKTIGELQALRNALTNRFGDEVYVNLNGASQHLALTLTFINSALNDKSLEERATRAQAAANIVKTSYARAKNLEAIWVVFVRQKTTMVVFHQTQTIDYFGFDKDAKRVTPPATGSSSSGVELKTAAVYIDTSHETDVSVSGIQLSGIPGEKGLTVLPHFRVAGDVKKGGARPPRQVSFDFASYSDKSEFRQTTRVSCGWQTDPAKRRNIHRHQHAVLLSDRSLPRIPPDDRCQTTHDQSRRQGLPADARTVCRATANGRVRERLSSHRFHSRWRRQSRLKNLTLADTRA